MTTEKRRRVIELLDAKSLLEAYDKYSRNFNPIDEGIIETFELLKAEIIKRCSVYTKVRDVYDAK